jgi:hypothetical protein
MLRHPTFDLWFHDDAELARLLGSPIEKRVTLHQWPLSCVQRLWCGDGRSWIYKTQAPPTVEPAFYRQAASPLLVAARSVPFAELPQAPPALVLEYAHAPRLSDCDVPAARAVEVVDDILGRIAQITGTLPALGDVRTESLWNDTADSIVADLRALVAGGSAPRLTGALADRIAGHCRSPLVHQALATPAGYVHCDLLATNVLVAGDGYRVVDWQRPIWGPVALDRASLLESLGVEVGPHVPPGVLLLGGLLLIGWFAQQARRWFPPGVDWFSSEIVRVAGKLDKQMRS